MLFEQGKIMATLKDHEKLCEIRYAAVEKRLDHLESKIDDIHKEIDGFKDFFLKLSVKLAVGVFTTICGAVFVIKF